MLPASEYPLLSHTISAGNNIIIAIRQRITPAPIANPIPEVVQNKPKRLNYSAAVRQEKKEMKTARLKREDSGAGERQKNLDRLYLNWDLFLHILKIALLNIHGNVANCRSEMRV